MKKIFVIAVFLVVVGILCAVFFSKSSGPEEKDDERPWTVGENATEETTQESTTVAVEKDPAMAFSNYVHGKLREDYAFLSTETPYTETDFQNAIFGLYVYDVDADDHEEMTLLRTAEDGVYLDVYEHKDGKVQYADSIKLALDPMNNVDFSTKLSDFRQIAARLTIYPHSQSRLFCLTVEQQTTDGDYNAYTVVCSYEKEKLSVKKSFRLRQRADVVTLMCTDNVTLLYRNAVGDVAETEDAGSMMKYTDINTAFKTEFAKIGLNAPQVSVENGKLTAYKVTPVDNAQTVFDFSGNTSGVTISDNGFLQSFILNV